MLLNLPTRAEHFAAGGDSASYLPRPPGRGTLAGREVQIAWVDHDSAAAPTDDSTPRWQPTRAVTGFVTGSPARAAVALQRVFPELSIRRLEEGAQEAAPAASTPLIWVGDADTWQREWMLTQRVRAAGEMLVAAELPTALRTLLGIRDLPPFARTHADRAWSVWEGGRPARVLVPGGQSVADASISSTW